ncbi:MAG TPA: AAA family ATPase [Candidatus Wujingus californicus]|uniref:AAA family ATPase n=1 Tax=Candidatus Wujingus californicus TaxID=3367618 RepID=UPI001DD6B4FA|nr:AAA family ATPase [Planctomycetota bacterium]MDO8094671.1 AAA family ATPase [Candidatus Brocadiales bacterium]MDO8130669.1 AAA family ATPase [Candidatus Brocadiales bacterium]
MNIIIKSTKSEWEGMAYVAIYGDVNKFRSTGIGQVETNFKDSYIILRNTQNNKECGGIIKTIQPNKEDFIEIDPCLLNDLSAAAGSDVEILPLKPISSKQVRIAVSKSDFVNPQEIQNLCKTYLARHPLKSGQRKPIYLFTGDKITVEILEVQPEDLAIFSASTQLIIDTEKTALSSEGLEEVGGLESEKKLIRERILLPIIQPEFFSAHGIRPPRGILLCGPPGCGKTMIARGLSEEIKANFVELNPSEVFNSLYGESEKVIKEKFTKAKGKTPAIILIDEIDAIGGSRTATRGDLERRVVTTLLTEMDGLRSLGNVIVVATTNTPDVLDLALRRPGRLDYEIHIGVPDKKGRMDILKKKTKHMILSDDVDLNEIARRTHGFVGADLMMLCREAAFEALTREHPIEELVGKRPEVNTGLQISKRDFDNALNRVKPSALREFAVEVPTNLGWKDVGGLASIKDTIIEEIIQVLNDPESFEKVGITPVKGILLYGPPGTGKTLIARIIANEAEANFISIKGPEVLSKWFGESEQRIRNLFSKARESSPCIIFFDEIDAISAARGKSISDAADRVVNQLLTEMDGFETSKHVCVIAATNRMELIDPALLRPGRFDYQIEVPLPDEAGRQEIFRIHLKSKPLADDIDLAKLVLESSQFSGAHIAEVCRRAALTAFREAIYVVPNTKVQMRHLLDAIEIVKKTISDVEKPKTGFFRQDRR